MARDWTKMAHEVVEAVGGTDNIAGLTHCITRLRFTLRDESIVDDKKVGQIEGVIQVMHAAGQYQIVIGQKVGDAYDAIGTEFPQIMLGGEVDADEAGVAQGKILDRLVGVVTGIFMPFLGGFSAAGMLKAVAVMCSSFGWLDTESSTYVILNAMGDGLFQFLPIALAYTAGVKFKVNQWITVAIAMFLCHPDMVALSTTFEGAQNFFGIPVIMPDSGYLQSVIPIVLTAALQSLIEPFFDRIFPDAVKGILAPMLTLSFTAILTLLVVGPVSNTVAGWIANGILTIMNAAPLVGGFLYAGLWPVLIIFGMHWAFIPVVMSNFGTLGYDFLLPISVGTNYAVGACCLAILLKSKNKGIKETATECMGSAWLGGITEPAIYGLLLKYKRPFIVMCVGCAFAGAIAAVNHVTQSVLLTTSMITLPAVYAACGIWEIVAVVVAVVFAFVGTYLWGYSDEMVEEA